MEEPEKLQRAHALVERGRDVIEEELLRIARLRMIGAATNCAEKMPRLLTSTQAALEDNLRRTQTKAVVRDEVQAL